MNDDQLDLARKFQTSPAFRLTVGMCFKVPDGESRVLSIHGGCVTVSIPTFRETTWGTPGEVVNDIRGVLDLTDAANDGVLFRMLGDGWHATFNQGARVFRAGESGQYFGETVAEACVHALMRTPDAYKILQLGGYP